jgi:serine/threonine-protein kinase PknK
MPVRPGATGPFCGQSPGGVLKDGMASESVDLGIDGVVDAVRVGQGGFGTVYRATQPAYRRTVAVKVLSSPLGDDVSRRSFEQECQALGSLSSHPHIVTLYG